MHLKFKIAEHFCGKKFLLEFYLIQYLSQHDNYYWNF